MDREWPCISEVMEMGMKNTITLYAMVHGHTRGMALRKGLTTKMVFTIPVSSLS